MSVCIPTYNGADYLEDCLRSALAQTYANVEVLVVDDCSSDDTLRIAQAHAHRDPRVQVLRNPKNLGLVGNWNRCVELARGEWVKFLFQDDLLHPQCVEKLVAEGQDQGRQLVACDRDFLFDGTIDADYRAAYERNRAAIRARLAPARGASAAEFAALLATSPRHNHLGEPTVTLIHRRAFAEHGLFNPDLAQICDLEFWARVGGQHGVAYVPETLATFRAHGGATSAANRRDRSYRASGLDPLRMVSAMLRSPAYATLRQHWQRVGQLDQMQAHERELAYRASAYARRHPRAPSDGRTVAEEYALFVAQHPQCGVTLVAHWLWQARGLPGRVRYRVGQWLNPLLPADWRRDKALPF